MTLTRRGVLLFAVLGWLRFHTLKLIPSIVVELILPVDEYRKCKSRRFPASQWRVVDRLEATTGSLAASWPWRPYQPRRYVIVQVYL